MLHAKIRAVLLANTHVSDLTGERIYPSVAAQNAEYPCIVYRQISRIYTHDTQGRDSMENARFQIDCYSHTLAQAMEICEAVREAMETKGFEVNYLEDYEAQTRLYRIVLDFSVFADQI